MKKENIWNIPNAISISRFFFALAVLFVLLKGHIFTAAIIYVIGALTDFLDGNIARIYNQKTKIGEILDASADRVLILFAVIGLFIANALDSLVLITILLWAALEIALALVITIRERKIWLNYVHRNSIRFSAVLVFLIVGWNLFQWPYINVLFWIALIFLIWTIADYAFWLVGRECGCFIKLGNKKEKTWL